MSSNSSAEQVGNDQEFKVHVKNNMPISKSGYLYVYVSNESSNIDLFFDNLQVTHIRGQILEETHYYPFGLTMAGISSKAAGGLENKHKYNGIEFENDLELNTYDAFFRELDPQTGRWWQIDPKTEEMYMWSTYASNFDNPIRYEDPLGDEPDEQCCGERLNKVWSGVKERVSEYTSKEGLMSLAFPVASLSKSLVEDPKGTVAGIGQTVYNGSIFGTVNNAVNNPKEFGKSLTDAVLIIAAEKLPGVAAKGKVSGTASANEVGLPNSANVIRGGTNTPELIEKGIGVHPSGNVGFSVECAICPVKELSKNLPHKQIGTTTVGEIRAAGGDVIKTSGKSPNHATVTNLSPQKASKLLTPTNKNPNKL